MTADLLSLPLGPEPRFLTGAQLHEYATELPRSLTAGAFAVAEQVTVFKSVGLPIEDLIVARAAADALREQRVA